jgi:hypothetical protein
MSSISGGVPGLAATYLKLVGVVPQRGLIAMVNEK